MLLTPSTPDVPNCYCSKGSAPYWSNPLFLIFDIRALWRSVLSARAPEYQKLKIVGYNSMAKCKALTGSAMKGLIHRLSTVTVVCGKHCIAKYGHLSCRDNNIPSSPHDNTEVQSPCSSALSIRHTRTVIGLHAYVCSSLTHARLLCRQFLL